MGDAVSSVDPLAASLTARSRRGGGLRRLRGPSEDELAARVGAGDEQAFAVLCRRRHHRLHAVACDVLRDHDEARDAVQEAAVKALGALRRGQLRGDVRPWLHRICVNEALSILRRRQAHLELTEARAGACAASGPERVVLLRERLTGVAEDLEQLPERQRRALLLREVAELPYAEVAGLLELSEEGARRAVADARRGLLDLAAGREDACADVRVLLADADGRSQRSRRLVAHLRGCPSCRSYRRARLRAAAHRALAPGVLAGAWPSWLPTLLPGGAGQASVVGTGRALALAATVALAPAVMDPGAPERARDAGGAVLERAGGTGASSGGRGPDAAHAVAADAARTRAAWRAAAHGVVPAAGRADGRAPRIGRSDAHVAGERARADARERDRETRGPGRTGAAGPTGDERGARGAAAHGGRRATGHGAHAEPASDGGRRTPSASGGHATEGGATRGGRRGAGTGEGAGDRSASTRVDGGRGSDRSGSGAADDRVATGDARSDGSAADGRAAAARRAAGGGPDAASGGATDASRTEPLGGRTRDGLDASGRAVYGR